jgi:hypothetical protein
MSIYHQIVNVKVSDPFASFLHVRLSTEDRTGQTAKRMESRIKDQGIKEPQYYSILKKIPKNKSD